MNKGYCQTDATGNVRCHCREGFWGARCEKGIHVLFVSCNIFSAAANKQNKKQTTKKPNKNIQQNSNKKTTPYFKVNFYLSKFVNIVKFYWFHRRKIFILIGICESKVFCHNNALCVSNYGKPSCFCRGGFEGPTCAFGKFLL